MEAAGESKKILPLDIVQCLNSFFFYETTEGEGNGKEDLVEEVKATVNEDLGSVSLTFVYLRKFSCLRICVRNFYEIRK